MNLNNKQKSNTFITPKLMVISLMVLVSCSGEPSTFAKVIELENAEVWEAYDSERLDYCRLRPKGSGTNFSDKGKIIVRNCSKLEMDEIKETYKGKYIIFKGFSTSYYDNKLTELKDGYVYKNIEIPNITDQSNLMVRTPPVRWYTIKNLYVTDRRIVDYLFNEDKKDTGDFNKPGIVPEPLTVLTIKGLISDVNPYDDWNGSKNYYIERRNTIIEEAIILDPRFD
tara:strand:- start:181 stop:858 length:678 start_codon:yes stop_codon:yes gene_type:complete